MSIQPKSLLSITLFAMIGASGYVSGAEQKPTSANVIRGLGESVPAGAKNISLSRLFKVYSFEKDGLKYVQINSLRDEVLTVMIVTPGAQQQLPVGSAAQVPMDDQHHWIAAVLALDRDPLLDASDLHKTCLVYGTAGYPASVIQGRFSRRRSTHCRRAHQQ